MNYNSCSSIDFNSNKTYKFKGSLKKFDFNNRFGYNENLIDSFEIQMDVKFTIIKEGDYPIVKMTGEYFYIGKGSKMPIEGEFSTKIDTPVRFYRNKNGVKREEFACYFIDYEFRGWWQHLERMDIHKFTLKQYLNY